MSRVCETFGAAAGRMAANEAARAGSGHAVFAVWTRPLDGQRMAGRLRTAQSIRRAISAGGGYGSAIMPSILSHRSPLRLVEAAVRLAGAVLQGRPLPLQCALFAAAADLDAVRRQIPRRGPIYLDGIRLYVLAAQLRAERPGQRIVIDIDDLLSRRTDLLLKSRQPQSTGYLTDQVPRFTRFWITALSRWILIYERATLRGVEKRAVEIADAVVVVSPAEAEALRAAVGPTLAARVHTIPPPVGPVRPPPTAFEQPDRFIFVGSDGLTQNRLTIDYLIALWRRHRPRTPLVLFGQHGRSLRLPDGIRAAGYVDNLADIYDPRSVLLTPSFIGGGIKTKVLEAFAHRVPVIGNRETFESLALADYPLMIAEEAGLVSLVLQPDAFVPLLRRAADQGHACVQTRYAPDAFGRRWRAVLDLTEPAPTPAAGRRVADQSQAPGDA